MLSSFIKPNQLAGPNDVIPPEILRNAKGLAVITVLKAGFLFSGRAGSGVVVARLPDGSWSPPSAIVTAGAGVGGQIGAELTDFVFILNTKSAVDSFSQMGSVTLGTNLSIAAGPLGRNAEAAGTASLKSVSAVFSYSKTKGLFAGVSLEGSAIIERREANRKFYGNNCKARNILSGQVDPPPACEPLMRVLESRVFSVPRDDGYYSDDYYDDVPDEFSDSASEFSSRNRQGANRSRSYSRGRGYSDDEDSEEEYRRSSGTHTSRTSYGGSATNKSHLSWEDRIYDNAGRDRDVENLNLKFNKTKISGGGGNTYSKPDFGGSAKTNSYQAIALYTFKGEQSGDLPFKKGDVIDILKKSDTTDDWWTGRSNGATGIFPANYVELI